MKLRRRESGRVFVLATFGLVVILAFTALASDLGYFQSQRWKMQTAADSAAMAGEQEVIACDTASVTAAAKNDATLNGFTDGSNNITVTVNNPPTSGDREGILFFADRNMSSTTVISHSRDGSSNRQPNSPSNGCTGCDSHQRLASHQPGRE